MGLLEILKLIGGILSFLEEVKWLVRTLQGTPEGERVKIMNGLRGKMDEFNKTGRPQ